MVKIRDNYKHTAIDRQGLAGARTLALDKLEKEAVVPKEFEHPRRTVQDVAVGPQGRSYMRTRQTGFFFLLRWLIGFFLPQL